MKELDSGLQHTDHVGGSDMQGAEEPDIRGVLCIALDHPALSSDPQVLCAAARSCKAWREAVQQCGVCNTAIAVDARSSLLQLHSFAQWLPKHAALVRSITASTAGPHDAIFGPFPGPGLQAAQQLLHQTLWETAAASNLNAAAPSQPPAATAPQAAATTICGTSAPRLSVASTAEPATAAAYSTADKVYPFPPQQQQRRGFRFASFTSNLPLAPALLPVLPAHSLTHLNLQLQPGDEAEHAGTELQQLARLSSLQQLSLDSRIMHTFSKGCLAGLAQLSTLTSLRLSGMWKGITQQLQQLLNEPLPLRQLQLQLSDFVQSNVYSLSHLTQLRELSIEHGGKHASLPVQLLRLALYNCKGLGPLLELQQLQHLTVVPYVGGRAEQKQLLQLAQLPSLQTLALICSRPSVEAAAAAAPTWALLPQLRELYVEFSLAEWGFEAQATYGQNMAAIVAGAAAATHLTSLQLQPIGSGQIGCNSGPAAVCASQVLAGLTRLERLGLESVSLVPGDALALTALTSLTWLSLSGVRDGVGNEAAAALAGSLKQLCHLDLCWCSLDLGSMKVLQGLGGLARLTELLLIGNSVLKQQGLMQLTGLTQLQHLDFPWSEEVADEVMGRFWAAVRLQQRFSHVF